MRRVVLYGASGHAKVVADAVEKEGKFEIAGMLDCAKPAGTEVFGYVVLGSVRDLPSLMEQFKFAAGLVTIGDNAARAGLTRAIGEKAPAFEFVTAVHPSAQIARGVVLGGGTVVLAGAVINSDARIGKACVINTGATVDHESCLGDYCYLSPGVSLGGNVCIGERTFIGIGACVGHGVSIGASTVIGAGSVVLSDIGDAVVAFGTPAGVSRSRSVGEPYL